MKNPFKQAKWKDAIVLEVLWSSAPHLSGVAALAIIESGEETQLWQWDDLENVSPQVAAIMPGGYDIRDASRVIAETAEVGISACHPSAIEVAGEVGWRAELLAVSWCRRSDDFFDIDALPSVLCTLTDEELEELLRVQGSLFNADLYDAAREIGPLAEGAASAYDLLKQSLPFPRPLFYTFHPMNGGAVFADPTDAERISTIHKAIRDSRTWGEFRRAVGQNEYRSIILRFRFGLFVVPKDDEELSVPGYDEGDYPERLQEKMEYSLPHYFLKRYGKRESTPNGSYWHIGKNSLPDLIADLNEIGYECIERSDLMFY